MHPIERLRYVARAGGAEPSVLVRETAGALAAVANDDSKGLVPACRRLIDRHVAVGPMWWLAARVLSAGDPVAEGWRAADEMDGDTTSSVLARNLPDDATLVIVGWPELIANAVRRRGDAEVLVIEAGGDGLALSRRLRDAGLDTAEVPDGGVAAAAVVANLVLVEALAAGPGGILAVAGSHAAAAVARAAEVPVWAVVGVGRVLLQPMWDALLARLDDSGAEPWDRPEELVPAALLDAVVTPAGLEAVETALGHSTAPVAPELLRSSAHDTPGTQ
jgi:hypothetical protein